MNELKTLKFVKEKGLNALQEKLDKGKQAVKKIEEGMS